MHPPWQGEMIQAKFGSSSVAERQLEIYSTAVLLATERPPKAPRCAADQTCYHVSACVSFLKLFYCGTTKSCQNEVAQALHVRDGWPPHT